MTEVWVIMLHGDIIAVGSDKDSALNMIEDDSEEGSYPPSDYELIRARLDTRTHVN